MPEPEGEVAGRLVVLVESSLKGFRKKLEQKVNDASKGVSAKVGVEIDAKKLRKELQAKVDEAAAGVIASIGVDLDDRSVGELKAKVEAAAKSAAATTTVTIDVDSGTVVRDTEAAQAEAEAVTGRGVKIGLFTRAKDLLLSVFRSKAEAQAAVDASGGIEVPIKPKGGGIFGSLFGSGGGGPGGGLRFRTLFRGGVIFGLLSMLEPLVSVIGQAVGGLTAMYGAADSAFGVLAAAPIGIATLVQALGAGKIATQGFGDALGLLSKQQSLATHGNKLSAAQQDQLDQVLKELSPSARKAAIEVVGLRGAWVKMRKGVQERFFKPIVGDIKPLAEKLLPLLRKELGATAGQLGRAIDSAARFLQTKQAQGDLGKVMSNNNIIFGDFLYMVGQFGHATLDFLVASRRFGRGAGDMLRNVGDWLAGKAARGRKTGSTAEFLDRATAKASQLFDIIKHIGGGIGGILSAGEGTGNDLLDRFDKFVTHWDEWTHSPEGAKYLQGWFKGLEGGFVELAQLIDDAFKGMAKWAADPKTQGLLRTIRTELGPALGQFLKKLSDDAAGTVIDFLTTLIQLADDLEPAVQVTSLLAKALLQLAKGIHAVLAASPDGGATFAKVLGGLLLLGTLGRGVKAISFISRLSKALKAAPEAARGAGSLAKGLEALAAASKGAEGAAATGGGLAKLLGKGGKLGTLLGLGGKVGKFGKMGLLKKAGIIGLLFTGFDVANAIKDSRSFGENQGNAIADGMADGIGSKSAKQAIRDAFAANFGEGNFGGGTQNLSSVFGTHLDGWLNGNVNLSEFMDKLDIDQTRLQDEIAKYGTTGDYYKQVIDQLNSLGDVKWGKGVLGKNGNVGKALGGILPGVDTDLEDAKNLRAALEKMAGQAQAAIRQSISDKVASGSRQLSLWNLFNLNGDLGPMPKRMRRTIATGLTTGLKNLQFPSVIGNPFEHLFDKAKPPKLPQGFKRQFTHSIKDLFDFGKDAGADPLASLLGAPLGVSGKKLEQQADNVAQTVGKSIRVIENAAKPKGGKKGKPLAGITDGLKDAGRKVQASKKQVTSALNGIDRVATKTSNKTKKALSGMFGGKGAGVQKLVSQAHKGESALGKLGTKSKSVSKQVNRSLSDLGKGSGKGFDKVKQSAERGMKGVVQAVQKAKGPTKQAATGVANNAKAGLQTLQGSANAAGSQAMAGFENGIRARGAGAIAAARSIAAQAAAAMRQALKIHSPSRVTTKIGEQTGEGLAKGTDGKKSRDRVKKAAKRLAAFLAENLKKALTGSEVKKITKAVGHLYDLIEKKAGKDRAKALRKRFSDEIAELKKNAKKRAAILKKLATEQAKLSDLQGKKQSLTDNLNSSAEDSSSIGTIASKYGGFLTPMQLIADLRSKLADWKKFRTLLTQLRNSGLGEKAYAQLVALGVDDGLPIAQQLAAGSKDQIAEINDLQSQIAAEATSIGSESSATYYDQGIAAAQAFIKELKKRQHELEKAAEKMADALVKALKKALGLDKKKDGKGKGGKSADGGDDSEPKDDKPGKPKGGNGGGKRRGHHGGRRAATPYLSGKTRTADAVKAGRKARKPGRLTDADTADDRPNISITGVPDKAVARDTLDEAMWALKKLKAGGKHSGKRARR